MTDVVWRPPPAAHTPVDVYKAGRLAAHMWRVGDVVEFRYDDDVRRVVVKQARDLSGAG